MRNEPSDTMTVGISSRKNGEFCATKPATKPATKTGKTRHKTPEKGGRPRKYQASVERYRAYRQRKKQATPHYRTQFTGEQEWYTPPAYLEAARAVLGTIDLDPASSDEAQKTVQAARYFTAKDSASAHAWTGRVFLNPPYTQPLIEQFVSRLVEEVQAGHVQEAILLTHNYSDTRWFHLAQATASCICFTKGRIKFVDSKGNVAAPTQGQAFFYFGENVPAFCKHFSSFGFIARSGKEVLPVEDDADVVP